MRAAVVALGLVLAACGGADAPADDTDAVEPPTDEPAETDDTEPAETDDTEPAETDDTDLPPADADSDGAPADVDCDDADATRFPGADEACNGVDDDCDGVVDDGVVPPTGWLDRDGDGFGDPDVPWSACVLPPFFVPAGGAPDCDDLDPDVRPGVPELAGDGIDQDCDGVEDCWTDADADGWGAGEARPGSSVNCDGLFEAGNGLDCDDGDALVFPRAPEACGSVDRDCDGTVGDLDPDAAGKLRFYLDADLDGFGDKLAPVDACLAPEDTVANDGDCNDDRFDVFPGAPEVCNDRDDDCDGLVDDADVDRVDPPTWFRDKDRDGAGDPDVTRAACDPVGDFDARSGLDCDDDLAFVRPGGVEQAGNTLDEDCDGRLRCFVDADGDGLAGFLTGDVAAASCEVPGYRASAGDCDDTDAAVTTFTWFFDGDLDGWGTPAVTATGCVAPARFTAVLGDCDDARRLVNPAAAEVPANGLDDDCDTREACWYDADADRAGGDLVLASIDLDCLDPGEALRSDDCDDGDPAIRPGAVESIGDGVDQDCDGRELCFLDSDGDGWGGLGLLTVPALDCVTPAAAARTGDCDDDEPLRHPGAGERCGGGDDDCDDLVDDADPDLVDAPPWFPDADRDGLGGASVRRACVAPDGFVAAPGDCDDTNPRFGAACPFAEVAVGAPGVRCLRRTDGAVACEGPVGLPANGVAIAASGEVACVVARDGAVVCAGPDGDPRLDVPSDADAIDVAVGPDAACAARAAGGVRCWGSDDAGLVGSAPDDVVSVALAVGADLACAATGDGVRCWGDGACDVDVRSAVDVAVVDGAVCLRDADGVLVCPDTCPVEPPPPASSLLRWSDLDADAGAGCAVTTDGLLACFGADRVVAVDVVAIDVGDAEVCGVLGTGEVGCWPLP